jgi:hypothetical protein
MRSIPHDPHTIPRNPAHGAVSWVAQELIPRVQCDCCGHEALSRFDMRKALPAGWAATRVRGRHACLRCASKLGLRKARATSGSYVC